MVISSQLLRNIGDYLGFYRLRPSPTPLLHALLAIVLHQVHHLYLHHQVDLPAVALLLLHEEDYCTSTTFVDSRERVEIDTTTTLSERVEIGSPLHDTTRPPPHSGL